MSRNPSVAFQLSRLLPALAATAACTVAFAQAPPLRTNAFDGDWAIHLDCADTKDSHGLVKGYQFVFGMKVAEGRIEGQYGSPGTSPSLHFTGEVREGGVLEIIADGITNQTEYVVGRAPRGTAYHYSMTGNLDGSHGVATRREIRPCTATFARGTGPVR